MNELTWTFPSGLFGTRAVALGFESAGVSGCTPIGTLFESEDESVIPPGYSNGFTVPVPAEALSDGMLIVQLEGGGGGGFDPANVSIDYGGLAMNIAWAEYMQTAEIQQGGIFAYLYVGDGSALADDTLTITITGMANPNIFSVNIRAQFVNGLLDAAPTVFEAGTVDVNETPLVIDPSAGDFAYLWTGAMTCHFGAAPSIILSGTDYTQLGAVLDTGLASGAAGYAFVEAVATTSYNCDCQVDPNAQTLAELRQRLLVRTGYATQATNAPSGVVLQYNDYLRSAQEYLYRRYKAMQTRRLFSWTLEEGVRFYDLQANVDTCTVRLDRYRIEGAWIQDANNTWRPLIYGIDPTFYTLDQNLGWPNYYEVRQCIEVFPPPELGAGTLWLKGNFQLAPFTADGDFTTIDAEPVFLWALGLAKSHKGDRDAGDPTPGQETGYYGMAIRYVKDLIANGHVNRRYIPGSPEIPIPTKPVMVAFDA